jgi:signal transduction histidine kinase
MSILKTWQKLPHSLLVKQFFLLSVNQRKILVTAIPITCLFASLATFAELKRTINIDAQQVQEAQQVQIETKQLLTALLNAKDNVLGYGLTRRNEFLIAYRASLSEIFDSLADLEPLVQDNSQQSQNLSHVRELVNQCISLMEQKLTLQQELKQLSGREEIVVPTALLYDWLEEGEATFNTTSYQINLFAQIEDQLLEKRKQHQASYRQMAWQVLCLAALIGTGGGILSIAMFRQIERERAAQQISLQQANQKLEAICDQLQRFTANASHELRAPLATVLSNAQVALMEPLEDPATLRQRFEKIADVTKSMSILVNDLLFLSRQEGSLGHDLLQSVDLVNLLQPLAHEWAAHAAAQSLHFSSQLPSAPMMVNADPALLKQAVINLLSNACHYTAPDGKIQLRLGQLQLNQNTQAVIEVEDNGVGIPESDLPYIFEQFYRVDKNRSPAKGRFGLGLAIAQHIVQAHQGTLSVNSTFGQGSTFQIALPISSHSSPEDKSP